MWRTIKHGVYEWRRIEIGVAAYKYWGEQWDAVSCDAIGCVIRVGDEWFVTPPIPASPREWDIGPFETKETAMLVAETMHGLAEEPWADKPVPKWEG